MRLRLYSKRRTRVSRPKNRGALPKDWRNSIPDRPSRPRRRANGQLVPVKNTASANNARGRVIVVRHAGDSKTLRLGKLDLRSSMGKAYRDHVRELSAHLGGDLTAPQRAFVDMAARMDLLCRIAWDQIVESGPFDKNGETRPALDSYRRIAADLREVLRTLGLERQAREVPDLQTYLKSKRLTLKARSEDAVDVEEIAK